MGTKWRQIHSQKLISEGFLLHQSDSRSLLIQHHYRKWARQQLNICPWLSFSFRKMTSSDLYSTDHEAKPTYQSPALRLLKPSSLHRFLSLFIIFYLGFRGTNTITWGNVGQFCWINIVFCRKKSKSLTKAFKIFLILDLPLLLFDLVFTRWLVYLYLVKTTWEESLA